MTIPSPLRNQHALAEAEFTVFPPEDVPADLPAPAGEESSLRVEVVATYGDVAAERKAIRTACALFDQPHRARLRVTGDDRLVFLNNMLTQALADVKPWHAVDSFWLNRKGRIDADPRVIILDDAILLDTDAAAIERARETLDAFVIADDVALESEAESFHRLALHGPSAPLLLRAVATREAGAPLSDLSVGGVCRATIAGAPVLIDRADALGAPGFELHVRTEDALTVHQQLIERGSLGDGDGGSEAAQINLRQVGQSAVDAERVIAGRPRSLVDFGPSNLPAETGLLHERVSFKKGCYLGQEVVARLHALGKPKQMMVALRAQTQAKGVPRGTPLRKDAESDPIGRITSCARSERLDALVALAMVKTAHAAPGTELVIEPELSAMRMTVEPRLDFALPTPHSA